MNQLEDQDKMPYGPYKGQYMEDVPGWWLLHQAKYWTNKTITMGSPLHLVLEYVKENKEILIKEVDEQRGQN